ncbi:MAG: ankyrin repeat domain-containing protein [Gammaproteobacteria bacterium]
MSRRQTDGCAQQGLFEPATLTPAEILKGMVTWIITPDHELPRNRLDSRHWYSKAAAQGHPMAQEKLNVSNIAARRTREAAPPEQPPNQDERLRWAAIKGNMQTASITITSGASVDSSDKYGRTALIEAAERGFTPIVQLLASNNANINHKDIYNHSALHAATSNGHLDTVKALIDAGADIDTMDSRSNTPLMIASSRNHMEIVRTLVERGAGLHNKNSTDDSAADLASRKHHNIILKYLQANGAYPEKHYGQNNASSSNDWP